MATYLFRCPDCSTFDVRTPMRSVTPTHPCPSCGLESRRVFTPPALGASAGATRAFDAAERSAESPQVVRSIPRGAPRPRSRRWSPVTGPRPVPAADRPAGPYQPLPRV